MLLSKVGIDRRADVPRLTSPPFSTSWVAVTVQQRSMDAVLHIGGQRQREVSVNGHQNTVRIAETTDRQHSEGSSMTAVSHVSMW